MTSRQRATPTTIEILYFDGCPNHEQLVTHLPDLLKQEGISVDLVLHEIRDDEQAIREHFLGSPTVRVNGHDIDPGAPQRSDYGLKCRIYQTPTSLSGSPPDQWILDAITANQAARP